jgi:predicted permease
MNMLAQVLPMVLLVLLGYGLRQAGVLRATDGKTIGKLLTTLALPAVIFKALATALMTPDLIYLPLSAFLVVLSLTLIAVLITQWIQWDRKRLGALITSFPTFEGGAVGYPLMLLAFGDVGLSRIVLFDLAQAVYLLTVVYSLSCWFGQTAITVRDVMDKLARTPFFWAIVLGLGVNVLNLNHPVLLELLTITGNSFLFLVLILLGMEFQIQVSSLGLYFLIAAIKLGCGLLLGWTCASVFGLSGVEQVAVIIGAALPPSMLTLLFAQENNLDTRFSASLISVAIPLSFLVLPIVIGAVS